MTKNRYIIALVSMICVLATLLSSCASGNKFTVNKDGKYVDKKTDIVYLAADGCYEPIAITDKLYGRLDKVELYEIEGADPEKWLCEQSGTVFYAENVGLPTLEEMSVSYALVVLEDVTLANISHRGTIEGLTDAYMNGISLTKPYWSDDAYEINWRIRFYDETRGICYVLTYIEVKEDLIVKDSEGNEINYGRKFFYNRFDSARLVPAGDILESYVEEYKNLNEA